MSLLNVDTIEPEGATTDLTLGAGGDKVVIPGTIKISGGSPGADKLLTSDADGDATWVDPASGGFLNKKVYTDASTTWTKPTGVTKIIVEVQGGGGGSGSTGANPDSAGVGGGGAYASKFLDVTNVATCTVTVGAGGVGDGAGGASEFVYLSGTVSFTTVSVAGGNAGGHNNYVSANITATPTTGDLNIAGQGGYSVQLGGSSMFGFGGTVRWNTGTGYGAGAGGPSPAATTGNSGTQGIVIVWEFK